MCNFLTFLCIFSVLGSWSVTTQAQPVEKEKVRPYQFGFTIDEQQHRYEKRDERGIVMGEFGFITADGIYHVTVYATDEEGKFRILAMKSYPYESPPKTIEMIVKPKPKPSVVTSTARAIVEQKLVPKHNFYNEACSGCFLGNGNGSPKSEDPKLVADRMKSGIRPLSKPLGPEKTPTASATPAKGSPASSAKGFGAGSAVQTPTASGSVAGSKGPATSGNNGPVTTTTTTGNKGVFAGTTTTAAKGAAAPQTPSTNARPGAPSGGFGGKSSGAGGSTAAGGSNGASGGGGAAGGGAGGRAGSSGSGGESGDLYRFKYTLDYNGHSETGSRNGNKEGKFFALGDDNVERTIEYIANEFGFQPRIRWRRLDASNVKPKENSLKDYEFVWFKKD